MITKDIHKLTLAEKMDFVRKNKDEIIREKKSMIKFTDISNATSYIFNPTQKADGEKDTVFVKIVGNTANWIDSQMDLIVPGAWNKSIKERKSLIPHLYDHNFSLEAKVGEVRDIYTQNLTFTQLGISGMGTTEALIFETDVIKSYNEKIFNQYRLGKINQHSIGLNYVQLILAVNDPQDSEHYENWRKYIDSAINKSVALDEGYFFIVKELKLIEVSAVLAGANEITPTLEIRTENIQAAKLAPESEPQLSTHKTINFDYLLKNI